MSKEITEILNKLNSIENLLKNNNTNIPFIENLGIKANKGMDSDFYKLVKERCPKGQEWIIDNLVIGWLSGSFLYGTNTETSDKDYIGVVMPPISAKLGFQKFEEIELSTKKSSVDRKNTKDDIDIKLYSFDKFVSLAMGCNPNIIELLFAPERCICYSTDLGRELMAHNTKFLNMRIAHSLAGYSFAQMKTLKTKKENMTGRKDLAEKYGYDTKFLMHCFRLLYEGIEIMTTGRLQLPLTCNVRLLQIKDGYYKTLDEAERDVDALMKQFEMAKTTAIIPHSCDFNYFNNWTIQKFTDFYFKEK